MRERLVRQEFLLLGTLRKSAQYAREAERDAGLIESARRRAREDQRREFAPPSESAPTP